ncbi:MAG: beta-ketoacyl-ACP synthase III [Gammaproteobacteria bacterium]
MSYQAVISGTGCYVPKNKVSNEALVASFNEYVSAFNRQHRNQIESKTLEALQPSSPEFIEKASGIKNRYLVDAAGILDPTRLRPKLTPRKNDEMSLQCEMAYHAAWAALDKAQARPEDIDLIIMACTNLERAYPSVSIELQQALGTKGYAFDMSMACSSATFGLNTAYQHIQTGQVKRVLMVNPEVCSGHLDFQNRDCHFIFGDVCTAVVIERHDLAQNPKFRIESTLLKTQFSNNIRNNSGFLNYSECADNGASGPDYHRFTQQGRKVFKEVVPMAAEHILEHLHACYLKVSDIKRFWLHQANLNMNQLISKKILGRDATQLEAPNVLEEYANTASAGSILAFHHYHDDFKSNEWGMLCSFGAGYSIGSIILRKV